MQEWDMKKYFNRFTAVLLLFAAALLVTGLLNKEGQKHDPRRWLIAGIFMGGRAC